MTKKKKDSNDMSIDDLLMESVSSAKNKEVKIIGDKCKTSSWDNIKTRKQISQKSSLKDWKNTDFFMYIKEQVESRFNVSYHQLTKISGAAQIDHLREKLKEHGKRNISNDILKNYLDWFLINKCPELIKKYGVFKIQYTKYANIIDSFFIDLDSTPILVMMDQETIIPDSKNTISESDLNAVFNLSPSSFVKRFGLILSVVYLVKCKEKTQSDAVCQIHQYVKSCLKKDPDSYKMIIESTEEHSPYALKCKFANVDIFLKELTEITGKPFDKTDIVFNRSAKVPDFLERMMRE